MNHHDADVLIIGAGPAGSAAAYDLAERGYKVLIVDRQSFPRHKACGGSLAKRTMERFRYPLTGIIRSEISKVTMTRKANVGTYIHSPVPVVCIVNRYDLDHFMLNKAMELGAVFMKVDRKLLGIEEGNQSINIVWKDFSVTAKWLIAADGANSQTRAVIFGKQPPLQCMAIEGDADVPDDLNGEDARCDFGYATRGYGWLVRKGDQVNVGLYTSQYHHDEMGQQQLKDYAKNIYGIKNLHNIKAAPIGTQGYKLPLVTKRVFFVGDAAGFADTIYGEGLFGALMTGQEAADCILGHSEENPAWESYEKKMRFWKRRLRYIRFLSFCLYHTLPVIYPLFRWHFNREWNKKEALTTKL